MGLRVRIFKELANFTLDVSWEMKNEIAVLFGPSGAGKSVTLQMIAGLMRPDKGVIASNGTTFFDKEAAVDVQPQRRSLGYVFQDRVLFPHMTVRQNISYGITKGGRDEKSQRVSQMLDLFHLQELASKYPREISGGQKQRVTLARALIGRPDALLLDEPFSALDTVLRNEMRQLLRDIRFQFDVPIVLVTHDMLEAYSLADTVIIYSEGRVVQTGSPEEVFYRPQHPDLDLFLALNFPLLVARNQPPE